MDALYNELNSIPWDDITRAKERVDVEKRIEAKQKQVDDLQKAGDEVLAEVNKKDGARRRKEEEAEAQR